METFKRSCSTAHRIDYKDLYGYIAISENVVFSILQATGNNIASDGHYKMCFISADLAMYTVKIPV